MRTQVGAETAGASIMGDQALDQMYSKLAVSSVNSQDNFNIISSFLVIDGLLILGLLTVGKQ